MCWKVLIPFAATVQAATLRLSWRLRSILVDLISASPCLRSLPPSPTEGSGPVMFLQELLRSQKSNGAEEESSVHSQLSFASVYNGMLSFEEAAVQHS